MELKAIIGIALVVFIVGGFIFCRSETERKSNCLGRRIKTPPLFTILRRLK